MDRGAWRATELDTAEQLTHTHTYPALNITCLSFCRLFATKLWFLIYSFLLHRLIIDFLPVSQKRENKSHFLLFSLQDMIYEWELKTFFFFFCFFWLHHPAYEILVPRPGIEPVPSAVKAWSPNYWTAREFPKVFILDSSIPCTL